jgi:hypothetical protein
MQPGRLARFARIEKRWQAELRQFSGPAFSAPALSSIALTASPTAPARPLVAPSEEHFHGGGLAAPLFREGRRTKDAQQSRKKKTMKTNTKNQIGLGSKSAQSSSTNSSTAATEATPQSALPTPRSDSRLPIDTEARKKNRTLPTPKVLNLLLTSAPDIYRLAEVVGKWVWVTFKEQPAAEIRQKLAQLGFHWNRERQAWQHPCGQFRLSSAYDPHEKYSSYYPARIRRTPKAQPAEAVAA